MSHLHPRNRTQSPPKPLINPAMPQLPTRRTIACAFVTALTMLALASCSPDEQVVHTSESEALADTLKQLVTEAYDFSHPEMVERLMALYPDSGPVISAAAGSVTTSRDSLELSIRAFWENIGQHMQRPTWVWGETHVDVLGRDAAVMTASYTIPHTAADGHPHTVGGVWTAVFVRRSGAWVIAHEHLSDRTIPREHH
jgi:ketosteroid isomerase-like protein